MKSFFGFSFPAQELDEYLETRMTEEGIAGLSYAVINDGKVRHHRTMGYADLEQELPISDKTIFEGASISKAVFAFLAMTYVEDGQLDLDKPLFEYLPNPDLAHDARYKDITARLVLCHQSGLPNWRENEEDGLLKIYSDPGTEYRYSGEGYQYLAIVLKQLEGQTWQGLESAFQKRVAIPLGMEHTVFIQTPYTRQHKAEPYEKGERVDWENNYWYKKDSGVFVAPSSIHSEPIDFSKWMIAIMDQELLTGSSYQEMLKDHVKIPATDLDIHYTLGFFSLPFPFANTYGHGGDNEGFTSYFMLNTKKDWGYVLFTNSEYGQQLGEELFEYLLFGPDLTIPIVVLIIFSLGVLSIIYLFVRWIMRNMRSAKITAQ